jgi:hypothetical protein
MTLETRIVALAQAIGADVKALRAADGDLTALGTTHKATLVGAINEILSLIGSSGAVIDDNAGDGNTAVTWSANKIFDSIEAAKTAVTNSLVNGAAAALDTLSELAAALGDDPNFAATIASEIANRVRFDVAQSLTTAQKTTARNNIGAVAAADVGDIDRNFVSDYATAKA